MKKRFIRINDISQIDTKKISVFDLNNRYIDPYGNMFALKYDRSARRVEIIKLERIHSSKVHSYQKKISEMRSGAIDSPHEGSSSVTDEIEDSSLFFDPDIFIDNVVSSADTHRERIKGITMNIEESNIITKEDKMDSTELDNIIRNLDIEGIQQLEKLDSYYRELTNFPRSLTYYQAKIDRDGKDLFDKLSINKEKTMRFVYFYEMEHTIRRTYRNLNKHLLELEGLIHRKEVDEIAGVTKHMKQAFTDAETSIKNTLEDINETIHNCDLLKEYAMNKNNY